MEISIKYIDSEDFIKKWLLIWSTEFDLSSKDIIILTAIINKYLSLKSKGLVQEDISDLLFSTKTRKEYQKICDISDYTLNHFLWEMRKKKIIHKNQIIRYLIPDNNLSFKFIQTPLEKDKAEKV